MEKVGEEEVEVVIVGAGIAGLATALALKRVGAKRVVVLERAPGLRTAGAALTLFPNAWRALASLGVADKLTPLFRAIQRARVINIVTGDTQEVTLPGEPGDEGLGVRCVNRRVLLETLAEELPPDAIRFSTKFTAIETQSPKDASSGVVLHLNDGTVIRAKVLIGCDGVHSAVAHWLGLSAPVDSGRAAVRGLAVYPDGHGLDRGIQQFLGHTGRAGIVPMNDTEVFWFITNRSEPGEEEVARHPDLLLKHVTETMAKDYPPQFLDLVRHTGPSALSWAPLMLRVPWNVILGPTHRGNVAVSGDALHPMTPDLGQGGCAALEDAVVLGRNLAACLRLDGSVDTGRVAGCLAGFVAERKWRTARLITGAYASGWVQQGGAGWLGTVVRFLRDSAFYRFFFPKIVSTIVDYDCGQLPTSVLSN